MQLQAYDVRKTLKSRTSTDFKINANDFKITYRKLENLIQTKDIEKTNRRTRSSPDSPATDDTGESNESGKETKVNGFAMFFLMETFEFLGGKFISIPWSKKRLVFRI